MVSEYQKKKKHPYSMYVEERCRQTGLPFQQGYVAFGAEWNELSDDKKEPHKERAKEYNEKLKVECEKSLKEVPSAPSAKPARPKPITNAELRSGWKAPGLAHPKHIAEFMARARKRKYSPEREDGDSGSSSWNVNENAEVGLKSDPTSPQARVPKRVMYIGDDEADIVEMDEGGKQDFDEEDMTSTEQNFKNAVKAYGLLEYNAFVERLVVVFHAIPVVYAQGHKHGGNSAINRPVEIAVTGFTLKDGLQELLPSVFVDPGNIQAINHQAAEESRVERHGIPHSKDLLYSDPETLAFFKKFKLNDEYYSTYLALLRVCGYNPAEEAASQNLLPLFVFAKQARATEACFRWLYAEANKWATKNARQILPLLDFAKLEDFAKIALVMNEDKTVLPVLMYTRERIGKALEYQSNYKNFPALSSPCDYHQRHIGFKECAMGATKAAAFKMLDLLGPVYKLPKLDPRFVFMNRGPEEYDNASSDDED